ERGATVVVLAGLSADAIVLTLATWWTGATLAFLNPLSPESEIRDHLRRLRPALVLAEARDGVDLTSDAPTFTWDRDAAPLKALRGRLPAAPAPIPAAAEPDDIALLVGTSGTTG